MIKNNQNPQRVRQRKTKRKRSNEIQQLHPCGGSGESYAQTTKYNSLSDSKGFITIFPSTKKDTNCWEVNTSRTLTHEGGGDSQGLASMIKYTLTKYGADPGRVFSTGSSSGCMMTNVMMATYPDLISAASCYSGVAAGCLAGSPGASPISADPTCANGQNNKTPAEWAAQVKAMYPGYTGGYPRLATWHGTADSLVRYPNLGEQLKDRKSTRLNSSHSGESRMPSSA